MARAADPRGESWPRTITARPPNAERAGKGDAVTTPSRRGRPKGSKNKPKALLPGTRESPNTLKCLAFEIPSGEDMRRTLDTFARRRQLGLFILSGNGMVRNVTLLNLAVPTGVVTYGGPFHIVSITGAFPRATENQEATGITVSLTDVQSGAIVAGSVTGSLPAFGRVFVMAGTTADIHQELPNVQPAQVQPPGLFQSDLTEAQRQTNMMSEIHSLLGNDLSNLPPEHRNGRVV